jgi:hypothetical protein
MLISASKGTGSDFACRLRSARARVNKQPALAIHGQSTMSELGPMAACGYAP